MQTLTPTAVRLNNLSGSAADLDDSPDAPDGLWCTRLGAYVWVVYPSGGTLRYVGQTPTVGDVYAFRDPTGSDLFLDPAAGSDGNGTEGSPWNTLTATRVRSLVAGQALWIRDGSVAFPDTPTGVNSGTSGNRITIASYPGETGTLTFSDSANPGGTLLGGGEYWDFRGLGLYAENFGINLGSGSPTGAGDGDDMDYVRFIDCTGTRNSLSETDNSGIIQVVAGIGVEIIRGSYSCPAGAGSANQSLLWFDYVQNMKILGALLVGCGNPIYFKHTDVNSSGTPGGQVKNCIIRSAGRKVPASLNWVEYINNVFDTAGLALDEDGGGVAGGRNCTISHCTFYNSNIAGNNGNSIDNLLMTDCVLAGSSKLAVDAYTAAERNNDSDYTACTTGSHFWRDGTNRTLSAHQSAYSGQETNGVAGTITFAGSASSTPANWALAAGSNGENAASDGSDCGVNAANLLTVN